LSRPVSERPFELHLEVEANGFLYNMVRIVAGTLAPVGRGVQGEPWVRDVLEARNRAAAGPTAPAHGLFLVAVYYD
jgi:tRNA pseudouridine38-40 synthase